MPDREIVRCGGACFVLGALSVIPIFSRHNNLLPLWTIILGRC